MKKRSIRPTVVAVAVHLLIMIAVLLPPIAVRATGTVVYLETAPVDPRDLFRGDYVALGYRVGQGILPRASREESRRTGKPLYVTVTTARPARLLTVGFERPIPQPGQACLIGRARQEWGGEGGTVDFPQIAQFFVPEGEGQKLEESRGERLLAKVVVSRTCDAVLLALEQR